MGTEIDRETAYAILNTHSWEAGMCHVHPEDVADVARAREVFRQVVECGHCEDVYPSTRPCPNAHAVTLELWGFTINPDGSWSCE